MVWFWRELSSREDAPSHPKPPKPLGSALPAPRAASREGAAGWHRSELTADVGELGHSLGARMGMRNSGEKSCWTSPCSPWERHLSSAAQPDSLSDVFWLLWAVLNGSALLSLLRDWDVLPCLVRSLLASLLLSPLLPCRQKKIFFFGGDED